MVNAEFVKNALNHLSPLSNPLWGSMNAIQMVEHLTETMQLPLLNTIEIPLHEKHAVMKRIFIDGTAEFKPNFASPIYPNGVPDAKAEDLEKAKEDLLKQLDIFNLEVAAPHFTQKLHPTFGMLNANEWHIFNEKHFKHHFKQFGLID